MLFHCTLLFLVALASSVEFKKHSYESMSNWQPTEVNEECPIYVYCQPTDRGFGDKMVWYIYCMNVAKIFEGTLLVDPKPGIDVSECTFG
mgnify:CR=1 FL=1